jgi:hypothetical protein
MFNRSLIVGFSNTEKRMFLLYFNREVPAIKQLVDFHDCVHLQVLEVELKTFTKIEDAYHKKPHLCILLVAGLSKSTNNTIVQILLRLCKWNISWKASLHSKFHLTRCG